MSFFRARSPHRTRNRWLPLLLVVFCVVSACSLQGASLTNVTAESVLRSKSIAALFKKVQKTTLLELVSREDARPWYVDDALLLLELRNGRWVLAHAVRNPRFPAGSKSRSTEWMMHNVMDAPYMGHRTFDHRPTRLELERFMKDTDWPAEALQGWRIVGRLRDSEVWQRTLGFKPESIRLRSTPKP